MVWVWGIAAIIYLIFLIWYFNWKGPLTLDEITFYQERFAQNTGASPTDPEIIGQFLAEDDGKEFVMLNLVRFHEGEVAHPDTGEMTSGPKLIQGYFGPFMRAMIKRGGHPVYIARKKGGYIDSWKSADDQGWHIVGAMRYRSRRDLVALASDPRFSDGHKFKLAAIEATMSFPMQMQISTYLRPKLWVPAALVLLASLAQNFIFIFGGAS